MRKRNLLEIDWLLITPVSILIVVSLITLFSISPSFFQSQFIYLILAIFTFLFFSYLDIELLAELIFPIYVISLILLLIVLGIGFESHGAIRWIDIFGIRIQFSEILKPFLILVLASFLSKTQISYKKQFILTNIFLLPIVFLIILQPDLGNALIYIGVTVLTLIIFGFPLLWFFLSLLPFLFVSPFIWQILHDYQRQRIITFLQPSHDPQGKSYNVIQAVIAVGSGMFMGKGLSQGTQSSLRFLPERHTDFIFATLSEELGFIGGLLVIVCFIFLCYRIYTIYASSQSTLAKHFTVGAFCLILIHFFVNIGMNLGIVPIVGVTLPFVSFGGSSLVSNFILLGILSSISKSMKDKYVLEIR